MTYSTFNEDQHPRSRGGQFTAHVGEEQTGSLADGLPAPRTNSTQAYGFPARTVDRIVFHPAKAFERINRIGMSEDYGLKWTDGRRSNMRVSHDPARGTVYLADDNTGERAMIAECVTSEQLQDAFAQVENRYHPEEVDNLLTALRNQQRPPDFGPAGSA